MLRYRLFAACVVLAYALCEWRGLDLWPGSTHARIPASVRSSPGGYRTYHTSHGFHGGK